MNVRELISRLEKFDGDMPVHWEENGGYTQEVEAVVSDTLDQDDQPVAIVLLTTANSSKAKS